MDQIMETTCKVANERIEKKTDDVENLRKGKREFGVGVVCFSQED